MTVFAWLVTAQHDLLPVLLNDGHYTPTMIGVVSFVWSLSFAALVTLWFREPHTVIDVWLMVMMCAWLFDIALSAIVNVARFDLGFYAGRLYGLCASSFVLAVLLIENVRLQARTVGLVGDAAAAVGLGAGLLCRARAAVQRRRRILQRRHHHPVARRHHHRLEQGGRAPVRLFRSEAIGQPIDIIMPPDRAPKSARCSNGSATARVIDQHETVRMRKDGRAIDVVLNISPLRSADRQIIGASKIARDIAERSGRRKALNREIEERQRIFETSQDLILVTDGYGNFIQVSPSVKTSSVTSRTT